MILLWGIRGDGPLAAIRQEIERQGWPLFFLDQQAVLETSMEMSVDDKVTGRLSLRSCEIGLNEITSVYLRPYDSRRMRAVRQAGQNSPAWRHALALEDALLCWAELTPALVINRPSAMASNNSKPYQVSLISSPGISIPDTLVTTDVQVALDFWAEHGTVIYKSVSSVRSIVSRLSHEQRHSLEGIAHCPTQFQEYIEGIDYRVHVVGEEIFATEICSTADDYRYADRQGTTITLRPYRLPDEIVGGCRKIATALQLSIAGIDLRRTPAGKWYCFEVNPSPGFTFYQEATGQRISEAIARLLARAYL